MPRGGARNRSGPPPDPKSERSEKRGYSLTALPAEGYSGEPPTWPLPNMSEREAELWAWVWTTPQACAWSMPSESWRLIAISHWVRTAVLCESSEATAADKNALHRFADQIGMTPAGLRENGWAIAKDELAGKREPAAPTEPAVRPARRLRAADAQ